MFEDAPNEFYAESDGEVFVTTHEIESADIFHTCPGCRYLNMSDQMSIIELEELENVRPCKACTGELNRNIVEAMNDE